MPGLRSTLARGWKNFRFPTGSSGNTGWGGSFFGSLFPLLPATRFDYRRECGPLEDVPPNLLPHDEPDQRGNDAIVLRQRYQGYASGGMACPDRPYLILRQFG